MKVTQGNTPILLDAYLKQVQQQRQQQAEVQQSDMGGSATSDKVQLSARARQIQQAAQALGTGTDVRDEKVRQVKMDIEKGTYQVNGGQVAMDMLKEAFENNSVLRKIDTRA